MPLASEAAASIYGAYRLARLDAGGLAYFNTTVAGAWRSFFAAVIIAPFHFALLSMASRTNLLDLDPARFWSAEVLAYVVSWAAFPVIMAALTEALGRGERFVTFVVVYNWASVIQASLFIPLNMLITVGVIPPPVSGLLWLAALGAILGYLWFIAKTVLAITAVVAVSIVGLDLVLGIMISLIADSMH